MKQAGRRVVVAVVLLGAMHLPVQAEGPQTTESQEAGQIISASGIKGGLVVHVGCEDGKLTAALRGNDSYLVHGLEKDPANVEKARAYIRSLGLYGKVSVDLWTGGRLPYTDNLVNLLISKDLQGIGMPEVLRVLAPEGVAYVKADSKWTKTVKPRPKEIDEWTHFLHGPDNNAVAQDTVVGPPYHLQWVAEPKWTRSHGHLASLSAAVSSGGPSAASAVELAPPLPGAKAITRFASPHAAMGPYSQRSPR